MSRSTMEKNSDKGNKKVNSDEKTLDNVNDSYI
jgi:hypothetical protein